MKLYPVPHIIDPEHPPINGSVMEAPSFCIKSARRICTEFYKKIRGQNGFHQCPFGFATYVFNSPQGDSCILTCLKIDGVFDRKKIRSKCDGEFNYPLTVEQMNDLLGKHKFYVDMHDNVVHLREVADHLNDFISDTIHELRKLNAALKSQAESAIFDLNESTNPEAQGIKYRLDNIFATSSIMSIRLNAYDATVNPDILTAGSKKYTEIFRKFEKAKHCLQIFTTKKNIRINFLGKCYSSGNLLDLFELLPFILLENAIKYSLPNGQVSVEYSNSNDKLKINIKSVGPQTAPDEINNIFNRKFRGENARKTVSGTGIGLYLAKRICDVHNIEMSAYSSTDVAEIKNEIPYSTFCITLIFSDINFVGNL